MTPREFFKTKPHPGQMIFVKGLEDDNVFDNDLVEVLSLLNRDGFLGVLVDVSNIKMQDPIYHHGDRNEFPGKKCWNLHSNSIEIIPYEKIPFTDKEMEEIFV